MLGRAALRRCPNCGERDIWRGWLTIRDRCPRCGIRLDLGESDHFYGAYMLNFIAAELAVAFAFVVTLVVTWPTVPWTAVTWGTVVIAVVAPFLFYPFTRTLWLAVDLAVRPEHRRAH
jgi:uncharacterized protein (DUF983 family)